MAPVAASPTPIAAPLPTIPSVIPAKDKKAAARKRFEDVYAVVRDDLLADFRKHNMPEESIEYYRRVRPFSLIYFSLLHSRCDRPDRAWTTTSLAENSTVA